MIGDRHLALPALYVASVNPFLASASLMLVFGFVELTKSDNIVSGLGFASSIVLAIYGFWDQWRKRRDRELKEEIRSLGAQWERSQVRIHDLESSLKHEKDERVKDRFEIAQLSAEILRDRGVLAHSGTRRPLRPAVAVAAQEVLVVEDDPPLRQAAARILEHHGLRVETAESVGEAIALVHARERVGPRFDFLLLDMNLPDGCGAEVLEEVRRLNVDTDVIVCSGRIEEELLVRVRASAPSAILIKPIELDELLSLLGIPPRAGGA